MSEVQPSNPQSDPHGNVDPPDVNERSNPVQTAAQTATGLSAAAIMALIFTPIGLIVACIAIVLFTQIGR